MSLDLTVLHDSGEETCFADVDTLFDHSTEDSRIAGRATVNPFIDTDISIPITVTEADVKRGYIVLDANFTELLYKSVAAPNEVTSGSKTTITVVHPDAGTQVHTKYPFSTVQYGSFLTLGPNALKKKND